MTQYFDFTQQSEPDFSDFLVGYRGTTYSRFSLTDLNKLFGDLTYANSGSANAETVIVADGLGGVNWKQLILDGAYAADWDGDIDQAPSRNALYDKFELQQGEIDSKASQTDLINHTGNMNNPHGTDKTDVGLGNVDNTADADKPISSAQQAALDGKEPLIAPANLSTYFRGDKTFQLLNAETVGLENVDNTADVDKIVSNPQQAALDGKVDLNGDNLQAGAVNFAQINQDDVEGGQAGAKTKLASKEFVDLAVSGAIILQGDWDANTNTPDITTTTTTGHAWRVSVAGSTDLGGIADWGLNDLAVKSATGWIKIDREDITAVWGAITGDITAQADLIARFDLKEDAFTKNTAFNKDFGTIAGSVCEGNDSRLSDSRTPLAHANSHIDGSDDIPVATTGSKGLMSNTDKTKLNGIGTGAQVVSLQAGTNVTIDATDPQNPIVNSTGGGSGNIAEDTITSVSASTTVNTDSQIMQVDSSLNAVTLTLPATPAANQYVVVLADDNTDSNNITVDGNGSNINGAATFVINEERGAKCLLWNGSEWRIVYGFENIFYVEGGVVKTVNNLVMNASILSGQAGQVLDSEGNTGDFINEGTNIEYSNNNWRSSIISGGNAASTALSVIPIDSGFELTYDGDNGTYWNPSATGAFSVTIELSQASTVTSISATVAKLSGSNIQFTSFETSTDGTNFSSFWSASWTSSATFPTTETNTRAGSASSVTHVRLNCNTGGSSDNFVFTEISITGPDTQGVATTDTQIETQIYNGGAASLQPSSFRVSDNLDNTIAGTGAVELDYAIDGGAYQGSYISIDAFKALSNSIFNGITSLNLRLRNIGNSYFNKVEISVASVLAYCDATGFRVEDSGIESFKANKDLMKFTKALESSRAAVADADYQTTNDYYVGVESLTAPRTVTISTADITAGAREFIVKDESGAAGTHNITIATEGAETIDGAASQTISSNYGYIKLKSNGTNLFIIG